MIYHLTDTARPTGETSDRTMDWYVESGFIPFTVTDIEPPTALANHEVVFNGHDWEQWSIDTSGEGQ